MTIKSNRIAIICDWLIDFGGAELVISHLLELYPSADIYTSVCYMDHPMLEGRNIYTSWLQRVPFLNRRHKLAGMLRPWAFRSFDLSGYDIVICSSSAESKQVACGVWNKKNPSNPFSQGGMKPITNYQLPITICYCHTPTRYYWSHAKEYENMMEFGLLNPLVKGVFRLVKNWMQKVDYEAAQKVDYFIANSETTAKRIEKYYDRESEVIYPGVQIADILGNGGSGGGTVGAEMKTEDTMNTGGASFLPTEGFGTFPSKSTVSGLGERDYYISVGRCIPYKRFDLLVDAFNTNGKKLILCTATDTPLFRELKAKSKSNIDWKYRVSNEEKDELMRGAKAFLFPPEEDFGLVPVEAMAMGTPVIAYGAGGALETVIDGVTGVFFSPQIPEALNETIERFEKMEWDREKIKNHARGFSKEVFQGKINQYIEKILL